MSEIASKTNSGPNASLAQPLQRKAPGLIMTCCLQPFWRCYDSWCDGQSRGRFRIDGVAVGSIFAAAILMPTQTRMGKLIFLASMQAVASMMSGHHGEGRKSKLSGDVDKRLIDEQALPHDLHLDAEAIVNAHPMIVGLMPTQQQSGTSLPTAHTPVVMGQMAFEDEAIMSRPHMSRTAVHSLKPSVGQLQMAALSRPRFRL